MYTITYKTSYAIRTVKVDRPHLKNCMDNMRKMEKQGLIEIISIEG